MSNQHLLTFYKVIEACAQPGCPVCRLSENSVDRYLAALMYEQVTDGITREQLRQSLGFCNQHAYRLPDTGGGAPLGIGIIYRDLLNRVFEQLADIQYDRVRSWSLRAAQEAIDRGAPGGSDRGRRAGPKAESALPGLHLSRSDGNAGADRHCRGAGRRKGARRAGVFGGAVPGAPAPGA